MGMFDFLKVTGKGEQAETAQELESESADSSGTGDEQKLQTIEDIAAELAGNKEGLNQNAILEKLTLAIEKMSEVKSPVKEEKPEPAFVWSDDNHADIVESPAKLKAAIEATVVESLIPRIESLLKQREADLIKRFEGVAETTAAKNDFFKVNADLLPHKDYVQFVAEKLSDKYKSLDIDKFGQLVAKTVRKNLRLEDDSPALPMNGKSTRTQSSTKEDDKSTALMKSIFG